MHSTLLPSVISALLLSHSAAGVVVQPRSPAAANVTAVTLDIVNTQLAPDGFMRSESLRMYVHVIVLTTV